MTTDLFDRRGYGELGLSEDAEQLVYDLFTTAPPVPDAVLARALAPSTESSAASARLVIDPARALLFVPAAGAGALDADDATLELQDDMFIDEPVLLPEIER
jgi:hypothetical protein